jgi:hypothetical protein
MAHSCPVRGRSKLKLMVNIHLQEEYEEDDVKLTFGRIGGR